MAQNSKPHSPPLFDASEFDSWKKYLDEEGYVVLHNILSPDEYTHAFNLFKKDITKVSPKFNFDDSSTQDINTVPAIFGKGMAVFNGFGQSDAMWNMRTNKKIQSIFRRIYDTEELVTSLDGFSIFVSKDQKSKSWLHIDQNPKTTLYSIQSSFNFLPVKDTTDAGFVLVPKSHIDFKPKVTHSKDWIVCDDQPVDKSVKLIIPKNCLTLWNSKTIHANEGMTSNERKLNRLTCYITYQPKDKRSEKIKSKRINAYFIGATTSHWAHKCELKRYPFGFKSRYESRGFEKIVPKYDEELTEEGALKRTIPKNRLNLL